MLVLHLPGAFCGLPRDTPAVRERQAGENNVHFLDGDDGVRDCDGLHAEQLRVLSLEEYNDHQAKVEQTSMKIYKLTHFR